MKTEKVSLSLDSALVEEARRRANGRSFSAYVNEGLRRQIQADRLRDYLAGGSKKSAPFPRMLWLKLMLRGPTNPR